MLWYGDLNKLLPVGLLKSDISIIIAFAIVLKHRIRRALPCTASLQGELILVYSFSFLRRVGIFLPRSRFGLRFT